MRRATILILAASCAALAIAPSAATAKSTKFRGPIDQPFLPDPQGGARDVPEVDMKVNFAGKRPTVLFSFNYRGIYGPCAPGSTGCNDTGSRTQPGVVRDHPICFPLAPDVSRSFPIRNGRFSRTFRDEDVDGFSNTYKGGAPGSFFRVTGRVTKKSVTGTVHAYYVAPTIPPDVTGSGGQQGYTCDSGVIAYKASKTNLPSGDQTCRLAAAMAPVPRTCVPPGG